MAFKDLHKLKKIAVVEKESLTVEHLVVGKDIFALALYQELCKKFGSDLVRLLSEDEILESDLLPKGPSTVRGETNQNIFENEFPHLIKNKIQENSLFYKDMSWKSFKGRSKPETLKFNEEYFTDGRITIDENKTIESLLGVVEMNSLLLEINQTAYQVKIKSIAKKDTEEYLVECLNGTEFTTKNLYFGNSPFEFLSLYKKKEELSAKFIEFAESVKTPSALFLKFNFLESPLSDMQETLFIPLSYTHDWGHFVGEFKEKNGLQEIEFMHFLDEGEASEEDVSRTIRLLKRNLEKIFEKFLTTKKQEFISLEQEIGCLEIDDNLYQASLNDVNGSMKNLHFIGESAPLNITQSVEAMFEYSSKGLSGITRALIIYKELSKKI